MGGGEGVIVWSLRFPFLIFAGGFDVVLNAGVWISEVSRNEKTNF